MFYIVLFSVLMFFDVFWLEKEKKEGEDMGRIWTIHGDYTRNLTGGEKNIKNLCHLVCHAKPRLWLTQWTVALPASYLSMCPSW